MSGFENDMKSRFPIKVINMNEKKENKIEFRNAVFWFPKGINPRAILEFMGIEVRRSNRKVNQ